MGSKLGDLAAQNNPGPGAYDNHHHDNPNMKYAAKYKFGSASRLPAVRGLNVPGPGNYASSLVDKRQAPRFGFGTQQRENSPNKMNSTFPGPGEYKIGTIIGKDGPGVSMHQKLKPQGNDMTPGPGAYESTLKHKRAAPGYGVGTEKRTASQATM